MNRSKKEFSPFFTSYSLLIILDECQIPFFILNFYFILCFSHSFRPVETTIPTSLFFPSHLSSQFTSPVFGKGGLSTSAWPTLADGRTPAGLQEMLSWSSPAGWSANSLCACCKPDGRSASSSGAASSSASDATHRTHSSSLAELRRKAQEHSTASALLSGLAGFPGGLPLPLHLPLLPPLLSLSRRSEHHPHHLSGLLHQSQPATKDDS